MELKRRVSRGRVVSVAECQIRFVATLLHESCCSVSQPCVETLLKSGSSIPLFLVILCHGEPNNRIYSPAMSASQSSIAMPASAWTEPPWSGWIETTGDALLILEAA